MSERMYFHLIPFIISMLPISELRGGIPLALSQGMSPIQAYFLSVLGNTIPVFPLLVGFKSLIKIEIK